MSLQWEFNGGPFVISCDNCTDTYTCEGDDFYEALADAKSEGWLPRNIKGDWKHFCSPECEKDYSP